MHELPGPLSPLANYAQFITWQPKWDAVKNKYEKYPVCPVTGIRIDHLDPKSWMSYATAKALSVAKGLGVGFILTKNDPFFCVDLDAALVSGQWSPLAQELCNAFTGGAVEISYSGTGLHIFGVGQYPAKHRCKRDDLGLEFYTEGRFMAITGTGATGNAYQDCTPGINYLLDKYLPARIVFGTETWTVEPHPDWDGPQDDAELIKKMLSAKSSAAAAFGTRASLKDLWEGNEDVLAKCYPSVSGDVYNRSGADAALCQHLAFWTGKDCERMDRLFSMSALVRDKWVSRPDYRYDTITGGASWCKDVYKAKKKAVVHEPAPFEATEEVPEGAIRDGFQYLGLPQQLEYFKNCVYVARQHAVKIPNGTLLRTEQFKVKYGGYWFAMDSIGDKSSKNAWEVFTESQGVRFPQVDSVCFRPELGANAIVSEDDLTRVNVYVPVNVPRKAGDPTVFLNHFAKLLPVATDRDILLAYMASCVQYVGEKFRWAPFIQGLPGNGKSMLSRVVARAVGSRYSHSPLANDIANKFNEFIENKLFIYVDDIYTADRAEVLEVLKPMITESSLEIHPKGGAKYMADNRGNFMLNSNYKDGIRTVRGERRYAMFFTAQQTPGDLKRDGMDAKYMRRLDDWLKREHGYAIMAEYLHTYPIPEELDPRYMSEAPVTSSTEEALASSLGGAEQEIVEAVCMGLSGFCGGWVSSVALDRLLENKGFARKIHPNKRRAMLESLGYIAHPHLLDGRATCNVILDGGARPRLYVKKDSLNCQLRAGIVEAYIKAQTLSTVDSVAASIFNAKL